MMTIGETFFFSSLHTNSVRATAARPGIRESRFCWRVVTFIWSRPLAPSEAYCVSALLMPSASPVMVDQSM